MEEKLTNVKNENVNEERKYAVYMHTSPSGKRYIGMTNQKPEKRWNNGNGYKTQIFYNAVQKYGFDNFKHEILYAGLTRDEAEQKEIEMIAYYHSDDKKYGYNVEHGGNSAGKISDDTRLKMSYAQKERLSIPENNPMYMKTHTKEVRDIISKSRSRAVCQYSLDGKLICEYNSMIDASTKTGANVSNISSCCIGSSKTCKGYIWRYADESLTLEHLNWCISDNVGNSVKVRQYSKSGEFIREYNSVQDAHEISHVSYIGIIDCCKGRQKMSGNYIWRYANDEITDDYIMWCNEPKESKMNISVSQYTKDGKFVAIYDDIISAENNTGINRYRIFMCCDKTLKTAGGFIWLYSNESLTDEELQFRNFMLRIKNPVCQYSKNGDFINKYESMAEAHRITGVQHSDIWSCCNYKLKTAGGFIWLNEGDLLTQDIIDSCNIEYGNRAKKVYQYSKFGEFINCYNSCKEAGKLLGISNRGISACASGKRKTAGGFVWRYDEY